MYRKGNGQMKVLISGGAGFIGSHVAEEFLSKGHEVVIVDNLATGAKKNVPKGAKLYKNNLDDEYLKVIFEKERPSYVLHLAAQASVTVSMQYPYEDFYTNTAGTLKLLLLANQFQVKKFLFASTAAVYGEPSYLPIDEAHRLDPKSYYAQSKLSAENYIKLYDMLNGLDTCVLRFANVYGPRQNPDGEAGVISIFINRMLQDQEVAIYDGSQTRDFIYVKDVAKACYLAMKSERKGIFNISSGTETTITALYNLIANEIETSKAPIYKPARQEEIERSVLDNQRAQRELRWGVQNDLQNGLIETIRYYKKGLLLTNNKYGDSYEVELDYRNHYV